MHRLYSSCVASPMAKMGASCVSDLEKANNIRNDINKLIIDASGGDGKVITHQRWSRPPSDALQGRSEGRRDAFYLGRSTQV